MPSLATIRAGIEALDPLEKVEGAQQAGGGAGARGFVGTTQAGPGGGRGNNVVTSSAGNVGSAIKAPLSGGGFQEVSK